MDFNRELIALVSHYKPLYQLSARKTKEEVDAMWIEIAEKLDTDVVQCQRRWRTLRTAFGKHHKKAFLSSIDKSHPPPKPWSYYKPMAFLVGQIRHRSPRVKGSRQRERKSSNGVAESESLSSSDHNSEETSPSANHTITIYDPVNLPTDFGPNWDKDDAGGTPSGTSLDENPRKRKHGSDVQENAKTSNNKEWISDHSYDQIQQRVPTELRSCNNVERIASYRKQDFDNIDHFGMFIAAQLKTKPQAVVENYMKRITDVLFSNILVEVTISEQHSI